MNNMTRAAALAVLFGGLSHQVQAQAQDYPLPPLIKDLPPRYDIVSPGATDIMGFELGQPRAEAHALLETTFPGFYMASTPAPKGMTDDQGNQVAIQYMAIEAASGNVEQTGGTAELWLYYTTAISGERVGSIKRQEVYNKAQPEMKPFVEALIAKYGQPTFTQHDAGNSPGMTLQYVWYDGKLAVGGVLPNPQISDDELQYSMCTGIYAGGYDVTFDRVNEHPHCTASMTVQLIEGPTPDLIGSLFMKIDDHQRWFDNGLATDQYLESELQKLTDATVRADTPAL